MLDRVINLELLKEKLITGGYFYFKPDGSFVSKFTVLKKKKNEITTEKTTSFLNSFTEIQKEIPATVPVLASIDGKGVIYKRIEDEPGQNINAIVKANFPGANPDNFYTQLIKSENCSYLCIARKENVDAFLEEMKKAGFSVISIIPGPFSINSIINLIDGLKEELITSNHCLTIENKNVTEIVTIKEERCEEYKIGSELIKSEDIIPFSTGISYYISQSDGIKAPLVIKNIEEWQLKKIFKYASITILVGIFIVLLVNYFLFESYSSEYTILSQRYNLIQTKVNSLKDMEMQVQKKQKFIQENGLDSYTQLSFFVDRIAQTVPGTIVLTGLSVNPLQSKMDKDSELKFLMQTMIIKGNCKNSSGLDEWIKNLNNLDWISDISVSNYDYGEFELKISIKTNV